MLVTSVFRCGLVSTVQLWIFSGSFIHTPARPLRSVSRYVLPCARDYSLLPLTVLFWTVKNNCNISVVYGVAVEDLERNDGTPEKPYFMSKELMKILGKKNKNSNENADNEHEDKVK